MTPERRRIVEELYRKAYDLAPEEHSKLLEGAEPDIGREVESLLAQHRRQGPLDRFAGDLFADAGQAAVRPDAYAGRPTAERRLRPAKYTGRLIAHGIRIRSRPFCIYIEPCQPRDFSDHGATLAQIHFPRPAAFSLYP